MKLMKGKVNKCLQGRGSSEMELMEGWIKRIPPGSWEGMDLQVQYLHKMVYSGHGGAPALKAIKQTHPLHPRLSLPHASLPVL
jgi:hypothetical protein